MGVPRSLPRATDNFGRSPVIFTKYVCPSRGPVRPLQSVTAACYSERVLLADVLAPRFRFLDHFAREIEDQTSGQGSPMFQKEICA